MGWTERSLGALRVAACVACACERSDGATSTTVVDEIDTESGEESARESGDTTGASPTFPTGPWGDPRLLMSLNDPSADDDAPSVSADGLEIYFESDRGGDDDIYVATRSDPSLEFGEPVRVPGINVTAASDRTPAISPDGLALFFVSDRTNYRNPNEVFVSVRESLSASWSEPVPIEELSSFQEDLGPTPVADGGLIICSNRDDGPAGQNIFFGFADPAAGIYEPPSLVQPITTPWNECMARLRSDGLEIFLESDRDGSIGPMSLWTATRPSADDQFDELVPVANLNVMYAWQTGPWISADGHTLYFSSDRIGTFDLWYATR